MNALDILSLVALAFFLLMGLGTLLVLAYVPGYIARRRHSPWADAINVCGWVGILVPPIWMGALIWAFIRPRSGEGSAVTISESEAVDLAASISAISARLASLEQNVIARTHRDGGSLPC